MRNLYITFRITSSNEDLLNPYASNTVSFSVTEESSLSASPKKLFKISGPYHKPNK
jgi:hypothetical protein